MLSNGIVILDGADLVKIDFDGNFIWRCPHDYGFWGSPVHLKADWVVCASGDNKVHLIDEAGKIVRTTDLPTSVSTDILVGEAGDLWFGIGAAECAVTRIDPNGSIVYTEYVARDQGLRHPLTLAVDGSVWVATDEGLISLDAQSGRILARANDAKGVFCCISGALACPDGVLVAVVVSDNSCAVTKVANNGTILAQYSLPSIFRAQLVSYPRGGAWLVGSTVSPWEPVQNSDCIIIVRLLLDGKPETCTEVPAQRPVGSNSQSRR